jgi:hypothetical protein
MASYRKQRYTPPEEAGESFVTALCERAADLAVEAEIGGAFVYQLPLLSVWEWIGLRALRNAKNKLKDEEAAADAERREAERQRAELAARLGG